ncbi:MAG: DUF2784 domain-containing protein [Desulfobacterota bacterium]|nr:DUF2784 domain-containing protein [Thermodesulfobacteriota bacterium]MDW8001074.1 DUF2784 domain-containing protein [Deltaproteobacteria bacterium]
MVYKVLADFVILVHFFWILFLLFGAFFGLKSKKLRILHIFGLFFAFFIQTFDLYCPLTYLEIYIREKHEPDKAYAGSFIAYYVEKLIYIELSRILILLLTFCVVGTNLWIYARKTGIFRLLGLYCQRLREKV